MLYVADAASLKWLNTTGALLSQPYGQLELIDDRVTDVVYSCKGMQGEDK